MILIRIWLGITLCAIGVAIVNLGTRATMLGARVMPKAQRSDPPATMTTLTAEQASHVTFAGDAWVIGGSRVGKTMQRRATAAH